MTAVAFVVVALLWGSSAIVTTTQAVATPAALSVGWRMLIVAAAMALLALLRGAQLRLDRRDVPFVALQGALFFGINFVAFYEATRLAPSGVAAVVLSSSAVIAALVARWTLGAPLTGRAVAGLALGVVGLAAIFRGEIATLAREGGAEALAGLGFAFLAAASTACGTVVGARNQARGAPTLATMTWGALAGALVAFAWTAATAERPIVFFDPSPLYVGGLLYLAIAASCVAFLMYFDLVARLGPGRAAYTLAVAPLVALAASAAFEGLVLDAWLAVGAAAILAGNAIALAGGGGPRAKAWRVGGVSAMTRA